MLSEERVGVCRGFVVENRDEQSSEAVERDLNEPPGGRSVFGTECQRGQIFTYKLICASLQPVWPQNGGVSLAEVTRH